MQAAQVSALKTENIPVLKKYMINSAVVGGSIGAIIMGAVSIIYNFIDTSFILLPIFALAIGLPAGLFIGAFLGSMYYRLMLKLGRIPNEG